MTTKKPAPAGSDRRFAQAVDAFGKAFKALGKRDFEKAQALFDELLASHPDERDVLDRARSYRQLCVAALARKPAARPKGHDELLLQGVVKHNAGEYDDALKLLRQALEERPQSDDALYCIAASSALAGDPSGALEALTKAIELSPGCRAQARADADFDAMRDNEELIDLLYAQT
jgi:tetratricopeptide (TPR) repeat protein